MKDYIVEELLELFFEQIFFVGHQVSETLHAVHEGHQWHGCLGQKLVQQAEAIGKVVLGHIEAVIEVFF